MKELGIENAAYERRRVSRRTVDITNDKAVNFRIRRLRKYISYFGGRRLSTSSFRRRRDSCFNVFTSGWGGGNNGTYGNFVRYANHVSDSPIRRPRA